MTSMHQKEIPIPPRLARRPRNAAGFVVPWFVAWVDGVPDFRVVDAPKIEIAVRERRCWLCGEPLGAFLAFVIGPMCAVNRVSSEPPSHRECAEYAAKACPFLARPHARRRDQGLPEGTDAPAGIFLRRNPGVALVWVTRRFEPFTAMNGGVLFRVGDPTATLWFAEGRDATREEVLSSIDGGLPSLRDLAKLQGSRAERELQRAIDIAMTYLPAGSSTGARA